MHRAIAAYRIGDYEQARKGFERLARQGNPRAQTALGIMYAFGEGTSQDRGKAERWYRHAAEHGFAPAQYNLAMLYLEGDPLPRSKPKAIAWLKRAALQDHRFAVSKLRALDGYVYAEVLEAQRARRAESATDASPAFVSKLRASPLRRLDLRAPSPADLRAPDPAPLAHEPRVDSQSAPPAAGEPKVGDDRAPVRSAALPASNAASSATSSAASNATSNAKELAARAPSRGAAPESADRSPALERTPSVPAAESSSASVPAPASDPVAAPIGGRFAAQLFASRSQAVAEARLAHFRTQHGATFAPLRAQVLRARIGDPGAVWYRVRVAPMHSAQEAAQFCQTLRASAPSWECLPVNTRPGP